MSESDPYHGTATEDALCDVEGCDELARYIESGDGSRPRNPTKRCHGHKIDTGLWRDIARSVAVEVHTIDY